MVKYAKGSFVQFYEMFMFDEAAENEFGAIHSSFVDYSPNDANST